LTGGGGDRVVDLGQGAYDPHAAAATTGGRLDQHRQVLLHDLLGGDALQDRDTGVGHPLLRLDLAGHHPDRLGVGADPGQTGGLNLLGEVGVLRQEAVPRVDRIGTRAPGGLDDQVPTQVGVGGGAAGQVD